MMRSQNARQFPPPSDGRLTDGGKRGRNGGGERRTLVSFYSVLIQTVCDNEREFMMKNMVISDDNISNTWLIT